jgi:hypothetical protein
MGAEYHASAKYGFGATYEGNSLAAAFKSDREDFEMVEVVNGWLDERGLDLVRFDTGGDQWSGPQRWTVTVKAVGARGSKHSETPPLTRLAEPSEAEKAQLLAARSLLAEVSSLGNVAGPSGWMFLWDVA